ncbi:polymorphic toxin-type HINT domain-containing protein [Streptomyces sp. NPDC049040]|uniref:polymorphic toxin-type HINT domain-containing protein n=1 Tax=Streptomyces sp. NPDC049040 TaxID=3365593 RepID=UPI00371F9C54
MTCTDSILGTYNHDLDLIDLTVETAPGHATILHTTAQHPFWDDTSHAWVLAGQLIPGHALETVHNTHVRVTAVRIAPGEADMYNLTVDQLHTYYVLAGETPILVHNAAAGECFRGGQAGGAADFRSEAQRL